MDNSDSRLNLAGDRARQRLIRHAPDSLDSNYLSGPATKAPRGPALREARDKALPEENSRPFQTKSDADSRHAVKPCVALKFFAERLSFRIRLPSVIAVTFGTARKLFDGCELFFKEIRSSLSCVSFRRPSPQAPRLATQAETAHNLVITLYIFAFEVVQKTPALRDHLEQAAPRMVIFLVRLEMLRQLVNALAEQGNLHLWRTGIRVMRAVIGQYSLFCFFS